MIRPYDRVLSEFTEDFAALGFSKALDEDYCAVFCGPGFDLVVETERYYHPSLATSVRIGGEQFSLGVLRQLLDSGECSRDASELADLRAIADASDPAQAEEAVVAHLRLLFRQSLRFLGKAALSRQLFDPGFKQTYARAADEQLQKIKL
jgi:hypothetical protein